MNPDEWDRYLTWTDQKAGPDDLETARGISGCAIAGLLFWVALALLWAAFKAARVYW